MSCAGGETRGALTWQKGTTGLLRAGQLHFCLAEWSPQALGGAEVTGALWEILMGAAPAPPLAPVWERVSEREAGLLASVHPHLGSSQALSSRAPAKTEATILVPLPLGNWSEFSE